MSTRFPHVLLATGLALPFAVFAGGTVQLETGSGKDRAVTEVEFDGSKLRVTPKMTGETQAHVIYRDGKAYMVTGEAGAPMVMEMAGMMKMAGSMMQNQNLAPDTFDHVAQYHGLTATGRSETVAGVKGEVYRLDYTTTKGQRVSDEMVLTNNATLGEMSKVMAGFGASLAAAMGQPEAAGSKAVEAELTRRNLGVLRYRQDFRVTSVSSRSPAASRFVLPAAPTAMPDFGGMLGGDAAAGASGGASAGGGLGAIFGGKVERQQERIESRAEGEADAATDRAVDQVLDKAFGKIFGGE